MQWGCGMAVSRRGFLSVSGAATAANLIGGAQTAADAATLPAAAAVAKAGSMKANVPVVFHYPDALSPALAIKMSHPVDGGIGPGRDIVAYSQICVHKGCPVNYNSAEETFVCPCHYSVYDPGKTGEVVIGHASTKLPRILLAYDPATDNITAKGVDGLIYGRSNNRRLS